MKLSDFNKVNQIRHKMQTIQTFIKDFSTKPTCIATDYLGFKPEKILRINTSLANVIIIELERQVAELKDQLKELGVEVDERRNSKFYKGNNAKLS